MGLAKLQIWITSEGDPCAISERDEHDNTPWVVAIWHATADCLNGAGESTSTSSLAVGAWRSRCLRGAM
jgi:hypothetical protein